MERFASVGLFRAATIPEYAASMKHATVFITVCLPIENPQRIHDIVKSHRSAGPLEVQAQPQWRRRPTPTMQEWLVSH